MKVYTLQGSNNRLYELDYKSPVFAKIKDAKLEKEFMNLVDGANVNILSKKIDKFLDKYKKHKSYKAIVKNVKNWLADSVLNTLQAQADWTPVKTKDYNTLAEILSGFRMYWYPKQ